MVNIPSKQIDQMETKGENNQNSFVIEQDLHECLLCDAKLIEKCQLKNHLEIHVKGSHEGKMPFDCEIGNKEFPNKKSLKENIKDCNEEKKLLSEKKPFKCDTCNYQSSKRHDISRHVLLHTGVKPFHCDICEQKFAAKGLLDRHVASVHEGKKSFKCDT